LAQMRVKVKLITKLTAFGWDDAISNTLGNSLIDQRFLWPLWLRVASHTLITLYTGAEVESIEGKRGDFNIQVVQHPRYVHDDLCTGCGRCQAECSANVTSLLRGQKMTHSAIHTPILGAKAVPSAYVIDKNGFSPCQVACPLGINVQGFVSLLAKDKTDKALALINEAAPLAGILGRVCTHPCEDSCNRGQVDNPVYIQALHRYAADNATEDIEYNCKFPAKSREGKIAIVGSGPAGLTAAWELTRRGYSPAVFESHGVIGGMLATGIPRFRLPREVREREIEAIRKLGIDVRTGITVGRDVTFAYLKERGYRAFFLAIGAQQNNKLNIAGEELEGVVDCMPLLLALNLKVDTFVGRNVVVIGGGNAAIDAARAAYRSGSRKVTIFYRRTRAEMPAIPEEVKQALDEGVKIEYCTVPVEILGDGGKVTGVRFQRTNLSDQIRANSAHRPELIPNSDFVIDADHVVVAIGQSPNAPQLNMESLAIDSNTNIIQVSPVTLETSIPGVFAGGDCVTGPNNVVEAMAAGLRAAESIDRYMQGCDLEAGRSLEPPQTAEIDTEATEVSPHERAHMPTIRLQKRLNSFEETTTGLSTTTAQKEAQRCLNCALCSQCMECANVCELEAVFHDDGIRHFEVEAQAMLEFPSSILEDEVLIGKVDQDASAAGVHIVHPGGDGGLTNQVVKAMAIAMETAIELKAREVEESEEQDTVLGANPNDLNWASEQTIGSTKPVGVFLCCCGGSINSVIDFRTLCRKLSRLPEIACIRETAQACTEAGAKEIASQVTELRLDRVVLAACRCCNSEQVCYSCTDRRMMCHQYLNEHLILPYKTIVEFVNIREQCAWAHKDTPKGATRKALQMILAGIVRARMATSTSLEERAILPSALIIGGGFVDITAARALASHGYQVDLVARQSPERKQLLEQLQGSDVLVKTWPNALKLEGSPGNYEAVLEYDSQVDRIAAGAVLVNMEELNEGTTSLLTKALNSGLLGHIIARIGNSGYLAGVGDDLIREITIGERGGVFLMPPDGIELPEDQILHGLAAAARVATYLEQASISPRAMAVDINSKLCRGCGDCAGICPYIEMKENSNGTVYAYIDKVLCLGCGACIARCPVGAITQPLQSDKQIVRTLRSMLRRGRVLSDV
jgi:NADPH-dependent glutamate synthase beta subunit-like oxidoreductase/NAD-dependent dihydropyrimidine dehydrogenase PreA subunit